MKLLNKIDRWMNRRQGNSLLTFLSSIVSLIAPCNFTARPHSGYDPRRLFAAWGHVQSWLFGLAYAGMDDGIRMRGNAKDSQRVRRSFKTVHSQWLLFHVCLVWGVLLVGFSGNVTGSPFGEPVRYPSVPGTLLGIVQVNGQPVEAGAVLGFYKDSELRGRFEISNTQIVDGVSYFNAVIQQSGSSETLTKAVLWIPQTERVYELSLGFSMPLSADFGKFDGIQTFSFNHILFDASLISTLDSRVIDAGVAQEDQELVLSAGTFLSLDDVARIQGSALFTQHGSAMAWAPETARFNYRPRADFTGQELVFVPLPGSQEVPITYLNIQVTAFNDPPVILSRTYHFEEDQSIGFTLEASDVEGSALSYSMVMLPQHGSIAGTPPNLQFHPDAGYSGTDTLHVKVSDGEKESDTAVITFNIGAVNDAPTAFTQSIVIEEDTFGNLVLGATDPEGDPLSYRITQPPAHGEITGTLPVLRYQPNPQFAGADRFHFVVSDGSLESREAIVSILVTPVNDPPTMVERVYTVLEDQSADLILMATDPDQDALEFEIVSQTIHGTLSGTAPNLSYRPNPGYHGEDSFQVRVFDGVRFSDIATLQLLIEPVNDAPLAQPVDLQVWFQDQVNLPDLGSDPDGDPLSIEIVSPPQRGTVTRVNGQWMYHHTGSTLATDGFSYRVTDGELDSSPALVTVSVQRASFEIQSTARQLNEQAGETTLTLLRETHLDQPLTFALSASLPQRLELPESVTIPAGQQRLDLIVHAIDNLFFEGDIDVLLSLESPVLNAQQLTLTVLEDDLPSLTLTPLFPRISEQDGETRVSLFFNGPPSGEAFMVEIDSPDLNRIVFPSQIELPAGSSKAEFSVRALDNSIREGNQDVTLSASLSPTIQTGTILTILEDDVSNAGRLSDGWIAGATVFFDRNGNRQLDGNEPHTQTNETGQFWLDLPVATYDVNQDGRVDTADGVLVGIGGVDITTGLPQTSALLSSPAGRVISPLTTLVVLVIENNPAINEAEAVQQVRSALKMDGNTDVLNEDPFEAVQNGDASAMAMIQAAAKVQDTVLQVGQVLGSASQSSSEGFVNVARESMVQQIRAGQTLDLENDQWVTQYMDGTARASNVTLTAEILHAASAIVSQGNQQKDIIAQSGLSAASAAQEMVRNQAFTQSRVTSDLALLASNQTDPESLRLQYSSENYENLIRGTATGNLTQLDTRAGRFQFGATTYQVQEDGAYEKELLITRSAGSFGAVRLRVDFEGITASPDTDFKTNSLELRFESLQINHALSWGQILIDDSLVEDMETLRLSLIVLDSERDGAMVGEGGEAIVEIHDNDRVGQFQFSTGFHAVSESGSDISGVWIERSAGSLGEVTLLLDYLADDSEAALGTDFQWIRQEVVFSPGVTKRQIPIRIVQDNRVEQDEILQLRLRLHPDLSQGATLGQQTTLRLQLLNDDLGEPPLIIAPSKVTLLEDETMEPLTVMVTDSDSDDAVISVWVESKSRLVPQEQTQLQKLNDPGQWSLTATPALHANGNAVLSLHASDGFQTTSTTIQIEVEPVNDAPIILGLPNRIEVGTDGKQLHFEATDIETNSDDLTVLISARQDTKSLEHLFSLDRNGSQFQLHIKPNEAVIGEVVFQILVLDIEGLMAAHTCQVLFTGKGEVGPRIQYQRLPDNRLRLTWEEGFELFESESPGQPFLPLTGSVSPYEVQMEQTRFYILRSERIIP